MRKWIFILGCMFSQTLWAGSEQLSRPEWKLGDAWSYVRTEYATALSRRTEKTNVSVFVSERTTDYYTLTSARIDSEGRAQTSTQRWSQDLNYMNRQGEGSSWQEFRWYRWPLPAGTDWEVPWFIPSTGAMTWKAKVLGWDTITVPAGTFRAPRIELAASYFYNGVDGGAAGATDLLWYSPEIRRHVRLVRKSYKGAYGGADVLEELSAYKLQ